MTSSTTQGGGSQPVLLMASISDSSRSSDNEKQRSFSGELLASPILEEAISQGEAGSQTPKLEEAATPDDSWQYTAGQIAENLVSRANQEAAMLAASTVPLPPADLSSERSSREERLSSFDSEQSDTSTSPSPFATTKPKRYAPLTACKLVSAETASALTPVNVAAAQAAAVVSSDPSGKILIPILRSSDGDNTYTAMQVTQADERVGFDVLTTENNARNSLASFSVSAPDLVAARAVITSSAPQRGAQPAASVSETYNDLLDMYASLLRTRNNLASAVAAPPGGGTNWAPSNNSQSESEDMIVRLVKSALTLESPAAQSVNQPSTTTLSTAVKSDQGIIHKLRDTSLSIGRSASTGAAAVAAAGGTGGGKSKLNSYVDAVRSMMHTVVTSGGSLETLDSDFLASLGMDSPGIHSLREIMPLDDTADEDMYDEDGEDDENEDDCEDFPPARAAVEQLVNPTRVFARGMPGENEAGIREAELRILSEEMRACHAHSRLNRHGGLRSWDNDFVMKRQFSALIPAFDPRPGRTNVNQTQDVELPPVTDEVLVGDFPWKLQQRRRSSATSGSVGKGYSTNYVRPLVKSGR